MNQYRCETCNHCKKDLGWLPYCIKNGRRLQTTFTDMFGETGCASHSDYQSERDTVLEWMNQLEGYISNPDSLEDYHTAWTALKTRITGNHRKGILIDLLVAWLYEEGMKFEKECDTEDDYKDAVSACARRAQCYYTIHKIEELRQAGEP
jgi:hypothetical protein